MDGKLIRKAILTAKQVASKIEPGFARVPLATGGVPDEAEPTFYSGLHEALSGAKQKSAMPQDWRNIVPKLPGVKQEEIDATGLHDFLDQQQGQVPREALMQHVSSKAPQIEDVWRQKTHNYPHETPAQWERAISQAEGRRDFDEADRLNRAWEGLDENGSTASSTKFHKYQTPGGGNYKELLMTLPNHNKPIAGKASIREIPAQEPGAGKHEVTNSNGRYVGRFDSRKSAEIAAAANAKTDTSYQHKSDHWDEPNILAHVRMNDRTGPNGEKLLHLEEIQSDWHQQGREEGYRPQKEKELEQLVKRRDEIEALGRGAPEDKKQEWADAMNRIQALSKHTGVPDAPLKDTKDWTALALKRVMRHAADNGYKGITWTTGDQQADRYDLGKQIDRVYYKKHDDGTYEIEADPKNGGDKINLGKMNEEKLPHHIGKDVAEKIVNGHGGDAAAGDGWRFLKGVDLKVGGEGMREYYDKIVPSVANKLAKEHGVKASQMQLPELKKATSIMPPPQGKDGPWHLFDDSGDLMASADSRDELVKKRDSIGAVHFLPITPSMKGKKQRMFKRGGPVTTPKIDRALKVAYKAVGR